MVFGSLLLKRPRAVREGKVRELADALNALDYRRVTKLLTEDVVVSKVMGWRTRGIDAFVEKDRAFRAGVGRPKIRIDEVIHHDDELLVRGSLESDLIEVGGPSMWRIEFQGSLISSIEITRLENLGPAAA